MRELSVRTSGFTESVIRNMTRVANKYGAVNLSQGAYYVMVDISEFGYRDDYSFAMDLAEKVGVAAVPGSSFFKEDVKNYIRFHFAKQEETLQEALNRLESINKLKR